MYRAHRHDAPATGILTAVGIFLSFAAARSRTAAAERSLLLEDVMQAQRTEPARFELQAVHALINRRLHEGVCREASRQIPVYARAQVNKRGAGIVDIGIRALFTFFDARIDLQLRHPGLACRIAQSEIEIDARAGLEAVVRIQCLLHDRLAEITPVVG